MSSKVRNILPCKPPDRNNHGKTNTKTQKVSHPNSCHENKNRPRRFHGNLLRAMRQP